MFSHEERLKASSFIPFPTINYSWVGPPAHIPGHDVGGPISMAERNKKNPITFWCLGKYTEYYKAKFINYKNIRVRSIGAYLKAESIRGSSMLNKIYDTCFDEKAKRGSTRDKITFKDAFNLFLLQSIGGYILDTNIAPTGKDEVVLPMLEGDNIGFPASKDKPCTRHDFECWLMYSPKAGNYGAYVILKDFYDLWEASEMLRSSVPLQEYYQRMGQVIMQPIFNAFERGHVNVIRAVFCEHDYYADVLTLNLRKTYCNTHTFHMRTVYDSLLVSSESKDNALSEIFCLAYSGNITQLEIFIKYGGDIHEVINKNKAPQGMYKGETSLHLAIRGKGEDAHKVIKLLLDAGADPYLKADYPGKSLSAYDLMFGKEEYADILQNISKKAGGCCTIL